MNFVDIIARRRDGLASAPGDLAAVAQGAADGSVPDYQLAAWLMAAYLNPLNTQETAELTLAMAQSGEVLDRTGLPHPWFDKHSTGGVGDKTTIALLPILVACGMTVVKMSGRGLGMTGGTIDKLESVAGFRTDLEPEAMLDLARRTGLALSGQTPRLAPADKALYALRDVTGTVANVPLITASILSKKIAAGAECVVLDVKCGSGAFMSDLQAAQTLRKSLVQTGEAAGLRVVARVTDMDQPLGAAVGNALEVKEAIRVIQGADLSPTEARFRDLLIELAQDSLNVAGIDADPAAVIANGQAADVMRRWFAEQGGDTNAFDSEDWAGAPVRRTLVAEQAGTVAQVSAHGVGHAVLNLGAGRRTKADQIDPRVGAEVHVAVGTPVAAGEPLVTIHAASEADADAAESLLREAIRVSDAEVAPRPLFLD
jgi:pyrimidine-nucleoside phosphorylase